MREVGLHMRTQLEGPLLSVQTCARRLGPLGAVVVGATVHHGRSHVTLEWPVAGQGEGNACAISWHGSGKSDDEGSSEAVIQAASGLMYLHGRDLGAPRRLGLEIGSVAAGVLAAQGALAAQIGRLRGGSLMSVETSVLQAALLQASHYFAAATCNEEWVPAPPAEAPGPPFRSADGRWFEIETLDPDAWLDFWRRLGLDRSQIGRGWALFRPRYYRGTTSLPHGFHEAAGAHPLRELEGLARSLGVSLCPIRSYQEVLVEPGPGAGHPALSPTAAAPPPVRFQADGELPLEGVTVVEATNRLQGPLAGLLLQMLGARVIRVEPPGGDLGRAVPPLAGDTGSFFLCFNRGKSTVEIDLGSAAGRSELADLVSGADVFLHNWRPGNASRWGLAPEDLAPRHPGLVYVEASGWGDAPGTAGLVGTDFLVQAYAGLGYGLNPQSDPPAPSRVLLTDFMGALVTCEGALCGLYRREVEGQGSWVRTSLLGGAMALQAHVLDAVAEAAVNDRCQGRPLWGPLDRPLPTQDGFIVVSAGDDDALIRLCKAADVDPHAAARPALDSLVVASMRTRPAAAWHQVLTSEGIACAVVATDLAGLPFDDRFAPLFEPLADGSRAPATPWRFVL